MPALRMTSHAHLPLYTPCDTHAPTKKCAIHGFVARLTSATGKTLVKPSKRWQHYKPSSTTKRKFSG